MISVIFPYRGDLLQIVQSIDLEKYEVIVAGSPHKKLKQLDVKFVREENLATSLLKCMKISKGDYIVLMGNKTRAVNTCLKTMEKTADDGADIVIGKRNKKSQIARTLVNLLFPKSRLAKDPLSETFLIKKKVIENVKLHPIGSKLLLEVLAKGKYTRVDEIPILLYAENQFNEKMR